MVQNSIPPKSYLDLKREKLSDNKSWFHRLFVSRPKTKYFQIHDKRGKQDKLLFISHLA